MSRFHSASFSRRWLLALEVSLSALLAPWNAHADIIIDDFVDALRIDLPQANGDRFPSTNIGDLQASRSIIVGGIQTDPIGFLDVNQTYPSALTVQIPRTEHMKIANVEPTLWINLEYGLVSVPFTGVDLTGSGKNNALILTFDRLSAAAALRGLRASVTYGPTSAHYISTLMPLPQNAQPFTVVFPFDRFRLARGNPASEFVFSNARELGLLVELALLNPSLPEQLDFHMVLSEFRLGRVIPEPPTVIGLTFIGLLVVVRPPRLRQKEPNHDENFPHSCSSIGSARASRVPALRSTGFVR